MKQLIALWRLLRVFVHIVAGLGTVYLVFPRLSAAQKDVRVQVWARKMLACLAINLVVRGSPPPQGPVLMASNHISWLDIVVLHAVRHCRFISKADIQHWPLVGALATAAGTLYITRESRRDAMRVVHHMVECLQQGEVLAVFPEGTTGDGSRLLPFHANLLQAAISADVPIQPIALRFVDAATGATSFAPCYVGDDTLLQSLWRTLCSHGVEAVVTFGAQQVCDGRDRRAWATDLRATIAELRGDGVENL